MLDHPFDMTHRMAFLSYVREDQPNVDRLCHDLARRGVRIWLDRQQIRPGQRWKDAIRQAIREGSFFIACFSTEVSSKSRTYMNEELRLALEELSLRPTDRAWFIPVRLDECSIPDLRIGAGETLHDIQWVDLFNDWEAGIEKIVAVLNPSRCYYIKLFADAYEIIAAQCQPRSVALSNKQAFTVGLMAHSGVGKSTLIRALGDPRSLKEETSGGTPDIFYHSDIRIYKCDNDIEFADIPALGFGGFEVEGTVVERTLEFVRTRLDLVLYLISAGRHIHREELENVEKLRKCGKPCVVVINRLDELDLFRHGGTVSEVDVKTMLNVVHKNTSCPVVPLSALSGLNVDLLQTLINRIQQSFATLRPPYQPGNARGTGGAQSTSSTQPTAHPE